MDTSKPKFLLYQIGGEFLPLAMKLKEEGFDIFLYQRKREQIKGREDTAKGLLEPKEIVNDAWEVINKHSPSDLIILMDDNGEGEVADHLRKVGYAVIGSGAWTEDVEHERSKGTELAKRIGMNLPEEHDFVDLDDGIAFLQELPDNEERFVFKPEGEDFAGGSKTYTAKNVQDLIDYLIWLKNDCYENHYDIKKFIFQKFIEGIEADFECMFNGVDFMEGSVAIDIEEKKSGDGNKGEAVGCMGNIEFYVAKTPFFEKFIQKLTPFLRSSKYVGPISLNCIFAKDTPYNKKFVKDVEVGQPYFLEFTPRFGWDATTTQWAIMKDAGLNLSDWIMAIVNGEQFDFPHNVIGCGVRVYTGSISLQKEEVSGRRFSFEPEVYDNLYMHSVSFKDGSYMIEDNPVMVVNTVGKSLQKTIDECYDILKESINIPDPFYRMEIGKRAKEVITFLRKYQWI